VGPLEGADHEGFAPVMEGQVPASG